MLQDNPYLFTSLRLGFRAWQASDIALMVAINADADVMQFFPSTQSLGQTTAFVHRMQIQLPDKGYCYYAVDTLVDNDFIGFIGISDQTYEASFTPCTDIGWRLKKSAWNNGYATEGAKRCLQYAFEELRLPKVMGIAPAVNIQSWQVMRKAGMAQVGTFNHPLLAGNKRLEECVLYELARS